jgi:hypothetical protein
MITEYNLFGHTGLDSLNVISYSGFLCLFLLSLIIIKIKIFCKKKYLKVRAPVRAGTEQEREQSSDEDQVL